MRWYGACLAFATLAVAKSPTKYAHDASFTPDVVLSISRQNMSVGGIYKDTTLVNNSLPGPAVHIPTDKVVWIRVYNDLTEDNVTMHWHGLAQAAYPFSDGTPLASQWPIPAQHFFDYELKAPNGTAGTYYYHSHVGFQASTAAGPLIVDDAGEPPYKTDGERTIFLQEFWNKTDHQVEAGLEASPMVWSGEPNGWLINGKSISNYGIVDKSSKELAVIEVEADKEYRFRFVGSTSLSLGILGFQNHTGFEIIEADAHYTEPHAVDYIQIGSGQRYSAIFKTMICRELLQYGKQDFYIQIESRDRPAVVRSFAILRYKNCGIPTDQVPTNENPSVLPMKLPETINGYLDYALRPLHDNKFPSASEVTRRVIINTQQIGNGYYMWQLNNNTWTEDVDNPVPHTSPSEPYLVSMYKNQTAYLPDYESAVANGGLDPKTKTYPAKMGEVVEIVFQGIGAVISGASGGGLDTHPWHGHGMHHYDVGGGHGEWNSAVVEERLKGTKPVMRDTTILYRYTPTTGPGQKQGWRVWRIRIEQAGVWMLHCHTLQHMAMGMSTVWVHGDAKDIMKLNRPDVEGYLEYGGDVYGNSTHSPSVVHFHELM